MKPVLLLSIQLTAFCATALVFVWFMTRTAPTAKRLFRLTKLIPLSPPISKSIFRTVLDALSRALHRLPGGAGPSVNDKLKKRFLAAGIRTQSAMDSYFAARLLGPVAVLVLWTFFREISLFGIAVMAAGAYLGPDLWLTAKMKKRRERMRLGLPDALDLMVVCVDAGLGLDQALLRSGQELAASHPVIAEEFLQLNLEQKAGKPRVQAWRDMADRIQLDTVRGFATMLAQSDRFGTPVAKALNTFSDELRKKRSQQAGEMAAKATVKLLFPLVFFIFPSMFIVLLGPAALTIYRNLGK